MWGHNAVVDYMDKHFYECEPSFIMTDLKTRKDRDGDIPRCRQSHRGGSYDIAIIGDSHAEHLFIGLAKALPEKNVLYYEKRLTAVYVQQRVLRTFTILLRMMIASRR